MVADSLRSTLDSLELDPSVQEDRHYLITMLRRLGYTEVEIREALGEPVEVVEVVEAPVLEPEPAPEPIVETTTVELEYKENNVAVEDFEPVVPARSGEFSVVEPEEEEPESVRFEEIHNEEAQFQELRQAMPAGVRVKVFKAESLEEAAELAAQEGKTVVHTVPVQVRTRGQERRVDDWESVSEETSWEQEPSEASWEAEESTWEEEPAQDWSPVEEPETNDTDLGWEAPEESDAQWETEPTNEAVWESAEEAEETWESAPAEAQWEAPEEAAVPEPVAAPEGAYVHGDYVLHKKIMNGANGKEDVYFFVQGTSNEGAPSALPSGYAVKEFPGSGLPYVEKEA